MRWTFVVGLSLIPNLLFASSLENHHLPFNVSIKAPSSWYLLSKAEIDAIANYAKKKLDDPMEGKRRLLIMSDKQNGRSASLRLSLETNTIFSEDFILNLSEVDKSELDAMWYEGLNKSLVIYEYYPNQVDRSADNPAITMSYIRGSLTGEKGKWFVKVKYIPTQNGNLQLTTSYSLENPKWKTTLEQIEKSLKIDSSTYKPTKVSDTKFEKLIQSSIKNLNLPQKVDVITSLTNVSVKSGNWLRYDYHLSRRWIDILGENRLMNLDEKLSVRNTACSNLAIRTQLKHAQGIVYSYSDSENRVSNIYITCR